MASQDNYIKKRMYLILKFQNIYFLIFFHNLQIQIYSSNFYRHTPFEYTQQHNLKRTVAIINIVFKYRVWMGRQSNIGGMPK